MATIASETGATDTLPGVLSPVVTPFKADLSPDPDLFIAHCRWLISQNCGLAVFGTNSEANSLSVAERHDLLDALAEDGIPANHLLPGTGACALPDAIGLCQHAVSLGAAGVLMLPPFYYKGVPDDGLYAFYAEVIERVADANLRIYLYHIPPVSHVPISLKLIERLKTAYPATIAGIKDSSGDWANTKAMIEGFDDFAVYAGSETFLLATMQAGGAGCISATANVNPAKIAALQANWADDDAPDRQRELDAVRAAHAKFPMIAALKATMAAYTGNTEWSRLRPPLQALEPSQATALKSELEALGFDMPGIDN